MDAQAITPTDRDWMAHAFQLAGHGTIGTAPNPRVGCVVVRDGVLLSEGWHAQVGGPHAEVAALQALPPSVDARGATAYVTLEPCSHHGRTPPCSDALIAAGVERCVVAMPDPNPQVAGRGLQRMRDAGIAVAVFDTCAEGRWLNRRFLSAMERGRPWVVLKCAVSADGFMDPPRTTGQRGSLPITAPALQKLTHFWRAEEGAILVGANTVFTDDPSLNVREAKGPNPLPVILDPHGRTAPDATVYASDAGSLVVGGPKGIRGPVQQVTISEDTSAITAALQALQARDIRSVLVEGGRETLQRFMEAGLWDELRVATSPRPTGGGLPAPVWPGGDEALLRGAHPYGADHVRYWVNRSSAEWVGISPAPTLQVPLP